MFLRGSLFKFCRAQGNEVASRICNDGTEKSCQLSENVIDHSCLKDGKFNLFFSSFLPFYIFFCPRTGSHSLAMEVNSTLQLQEKSILQTVEIHQPKTTMAFVR